MKTCTKCDKSLELFNYYKHNLSTDGLSPSCKGCEKLIKQKYYINNKDKMKNDSRLWKIKNKDYVNSEQRDNRLKNKEKTNKYLREYKREARKDINIRLIDNLRNRLYSALKNNKKTGSAVNDLGCSMGEFKKHLESQFTEGMSWSNYGKWHIDHIVPLSKINISNKEGIKKACHYANLQPLWEVDNLAKGAKYV